MTPLALPLNLNQWIKEHKDELKPPVANKQILKDQGNIVQLVGGPNQRDDYHINAGPEIFYQLKGSMILKIIRDGVFEDIIIKEGELFVLPPNIPHSPQRAEHTVGLVIEQIRKSSEQDIMVWYCTSCHHKLYQESFYLKCIESDLVPVIDRFWANKDNQTCNQCGETMSPRHEAIYA